MDNTNEQKHEHSGGTPCIMCSLHKQLHGKSLCNICGGSNHFSVARIVLGVFIVMVTLWIGIEIGGAMGVDRDYDYDSGMHGGYYNHRMMMQDAYPNQMYNVAPVAAPSYAPAPRLNVPPLQQ